MPFHLHNPRLKLYGWGRIPRLYCLLFVLCFNSSHLNCVFCVFVFFFFLGSKFKNPKTLKNLKNTNIYIYVCVCVCVCIYCLKVCYMDINISLLNWNMLYIVEKLGKCVCSIISARLLWDDYKCWYQFIKVMYALFFSTLAHAHLLLFIKLSCRLILWNKYSLRTLSF